MREACPFEGTPQQGATAASKFHMSLIPGTKVTPHRPNQSTSFKQSRLREIT